MVVSDVMRRAFRHWADRSTGLGMWARQVRRRIRQRAHGRFRVANIAMLHAGRCGSSVLADMLSQVPDMCWADEPFERMLPAYYAMDPERRAHQAIADRMYQMRARYFGFDSKYLPEQHLAPALANKTPAQYIELLEQLLFTHYVLLNRRNHLKRAISVAIGTKTRVWNTNGAIGERVTVHLDPQRFVSYGREMALLDYFASLETRHAELRKLLDGKRLLELAYEDDVERDPAVGYSKICEFVGIPVAPVQVRLKKLNAYRSRDLVENFADVENALRGTRYDWMLDG